MDGSRQGKWLPTSADVINTFDAQRQRLEKLLDDGTSQAGERAVLEFRMVKMAVVRCGHPTEPSVHLAAAKTFFTDFRRTMQDFVASLAAARIMAAARDDGEQFFPDAVGHVSPALLVTFDSFLGNAEKSGGFSLCPAHRDAQTLECLPCRLIGFHNVHNIVTLLNRASRAKSGNS